MSPANDGFANRRHKWPLILAAVTIALVAIETTILVKNWPFTDGRMAESLGRATASSVRFGAYRQTFFPSPGCEAEQVTIVRGAMPLATIRKLRVQGSWAALLALQRYVPVLQADGLEVRLPRQIPPAVEAGNGRKRKRL